MVVNNPFIHDARVNKEAHSLSRAGYGITVYATHAKDLPDEERINNILVRRLPVRRYDLFRLNMLRSPFDFFPSLIKLIREKADVYHSHDLDTLLICYLASRFNKSKLVYDSHELFLEMENYNFEQVWYGRFASLFLIPVWGFVERLCSSKADHVITVNDSIRNILAKRLGLKRITVILNCPPFKKIVRGREFHKIFYLPKGVRVVLYQGGIMWKRAVKQLVDAMEYLPEYIYLIFMGGGGDKGALAKYASAKEYSGRIKFHEEVSLKDLPRHTASADLGVVPLLNVSLNNYYGLPNKLFEYMAAGIPVVASNFPEIKKIIVGEGIGICFDPDDPEDIARAIKKILLSEIGYKKMKENAARAAKEKYNWEIEEKKLLAVYNRL